jgi:putative SOS response-associated peptidase YedK
MIITEPNKFVSEVHDRMPVLLAEKDFAPWLSGKVGLELLKPAPEDALHRWPVSKRVNSSRASDEDHTTDRFIGVGGCRMASASLSHSAAMSR